ncbi:hypothetical protein YC2023_032747 [Brassica napus]
MGKRSSCVRLETLLLLCSVDGDVIYMGGFSANAKQMFMRRKLKVPRKLEHDMDSYWYEFQRFCIVLFASYVASLMILHQIIASIAYEKGGEATETSIVYVAELLTLMALLVDCNRITYQVTIIFLNSKTTV